MAHAHDPEHRAAPAQPGRRHPVARWVGVALLALLGLLIAAGGSLWWALHSERGSAWLLSRLPGVEVVRPHGTLLGDFGADALVWHFGSGGELRLAGVDWQGLEVYRSPGPAWALIWFDRLHAQQAHLTMPRASQTNRSPPPQDLRLPVELVVQSLGIDELQAQPLGAEPLRDVQAHVHLGDEEGRVHRIESLALSRGPLHASGHVRVGAPAPMPANVQLQLRQAAVGRWPGWSAQLALSGPLARSALQGRLATDTAPPQTLSLNARVRPFARWPFDQLHARAQSLDLSALVAGGPQTALNGRVDVDAADAEKPLEARVDMVNAAPGAWNTGRVPVRQIELVLGADPRERTQLTLRSMQLQLSDAQGPAGRVTGDGRWTATQGWTLNAALDDVRPDRLDARAVPLTVDGKLQLRAEESGSAPAARRTITVTAHLDGRSQERKTPPLAVQLQAALHTADGGDTQVALQELVATSGDARASLQGQARKPSGDAPWRTEGRFELARFDPARWWPGSSGAALRRSTNRLNAAGHFKLTLPASGPAQAWQSWLASLQGQADVRVGPSVLAGANLRGEMHLHGQDDAGGLQASVHADLAGNRIDGEGRFARDAARDHWQAQVDAPALRRLAPLVQAFTAGAAERLRTPAVTGTVRGELVVDGRWPQLRSHGQLAADALAWQGLALRHADARWRLGTARRAPVDIALDIAGVRIAGSAQVREVRSLDLRIEGSADAHRIALQASVNAAPPTWAETLQAAGTVPQPSATGPRTQARLIAEGGLLRDNGSAAWTDVAGWRGRIRTLDVRRAQAEAPLLHTEGVDLAYRAATDAHAARLQVEPARAQVLGGTVRWQRLAWQGGRAGAPSQIDADVTIEPLQAAPLLARLQPQFGWRGDLEVGGRVVVHTAPVLHVDVLLQRLGGDLRVEQSGAGARSLGLHALRVAVRADGTAWHAEAQAAGEALGQTLLTVSARTTPSDPWPGAATPIHGQLKARAPDISMYDPWLPVGWNLGGTLSADVRIDGRLGAPEFSGTVRGNGLAASNFIEGVRIHDGALLATLDGRSLRIDRFVAHAGEGTLRMQGTASFGAQPAAQLSVTADHFRALARVDRRVSVSGRAQLRLQGQRLALQGGFHVDDGLIDLGRKEAPELSQDVVFVDGAPPWAGSSEQAGTSRYPLNLDLRVDLGRNLRVRGRGINTLLSGEVRITSPDGRLALNGSVRTVQGTYEAYGEKLRIARGVISFYGPVANPRLDIEAVRDGLPDVEVGVAIAGTAQNPRVRLFSTPDMSELDKLSWLTMGRASTGLASDQSALLQRAALALLAQQRGGGGGGESIAKRLGLDTLSVGRGESGGLSDAVVSVGKQISERFYVGYQQSLDATSSGWELIYKIAQRFTVRLQTGETTAVDLIWTWLWG